MPKFDRTGPEGKGPRTGRGLGLSDDKTPEQNQPEKSKNSWLDFILKVLDIFKK